MNNTERRDAGVKLTALSREATRVSEKLLTDATAAVRQRVVAQGHLVERLFDREQRATHGLAWLATYVESIRQLARYADRLHASAALQPIEELLIQIGIGEYLGQILGGIPMKSRRDRPSRGRRAFPSGGRYPTHWAARRAHERQRRTPGAVDRAHPRSGRGDGWRQRAG